MAFKYSAKEFIKVYRKLLNWEWYGDVNTKTLFIHCLLRANWKSGEWQGIHFDAGEFITSLPTLAQESGLSVRQTRTALEHLETTGELTSRTTDKVTGKTLTKCRIITINNWDDYQGATGKTTDKTTGRASNKRQTSDTQNVRQPTCESTAVEEYKETVLRTVKEEKEEPAALSPPEDDIDWDSVEWVDLSAMSDEEYAAWEEKQRGKGAI